MKAAGSEEEEVGEGKGEGEIEGEEREERRGIETGIRSLGGAMRLMNRCLTHSESLFNKNPYLYPLKDIK